MWVHRKIIAHFGPFIQPNLVQVDREVMVHYVNKMSLLELKYDFFQIMPIKFNALQNKGILIQRKWVSLN